jgi:hypothetical protein
MIQCDVLKPGLGIKTLATLLPAPYNVMMVSIFCSINKGTTKIRIHEFYKCTCITFQYCTFKIDVTNIMKMNEQIKKVSNISPHSCKEKPT